MEYKMSFPIRKKKSNHYSQVKSIQFGVRDITTFIQVLLKPAKPNKYLRQAATRYKEKVKNCSSL